MYAPRVARVVYRSINPRRFTHFIGVLIRVEEEPGIDGLPRQRENVERPMNDVIPVPGDVQAAQLVVAARLILNCKVSLSYRQVDLESEQVDA